jgi:oxygen-independent coproporphyrinogen-3 oxidase
VSRLSFGVQSMVGEVLVAIGRTHDPDAVARAVAAARSTGFETFNLDLIYGGAGESLHDWRRSIEGALALDPPHVSAYALTVEPGTPLASHPDRHPDDDDQAAKYLVADELLGGAGRPWYEISNWARPGHECRHNLLTWAGGEYLGVGCAAHSHVAGRRWWNLRTPERYLAAVEAAEPAEAAGERLDAEGRAHERLVLALRTRAGAPRRPARGTARRAARGARRLGGADPRGATARQRGGRPTPGARLALGSRERADVPTPHPAPRCRPARPARPGHDPAARPGRLRRSAHDRRGGLCPRAARGVR